MGSVEEEKKIKYSIKGTEMSFDALAVVFHESIISCLEHLETKNVDWQKESQKLMEEIGLDAPDRVKKTIRAFLTFALQHHSEDRKETLSHETANEAADIVVMLENFGTVDQQEWGSLVGRDGWVPIVEKNHIQGSLCLCCAEPDFVEKRITMNGRECLFYDFDIVLAKAKFDAVEIEKAFETSAHIFMNSGKAYLCIRNPDLVIVDKTTATEDIDEDIYLHNKHIASRKGKVYGNVSTNIKHV